MLDLSANGLAYQHPLAKGQLKSRWGTSSLSVLLPHTVQVGSAILMRTGMIPASGNAPLLNFQTKSLIRGRRSPLCQLSCLETVSDLKQKLEEAKAEAEFYKFRCEIKEEELDELRRSEKQKVEEAETDAEFYKHKYAMKDEDVEAAKADTEYYKFKCDAKDEELEELEELLQNENQNVEAAKADTEYYKFKCDAKDEELDELQQSQEELLDELKRAKTRAKLHQRLIEELQILLDEDEPRRHALAPGAVGEAFSNWHGITCEPETWHPTTVCSRCRDEEACVVVLPCNHLCLCVACELETDRCPDCRATKSGSVLA